MRFILTEPEFVDQSFGYLAFEWSGFYDDKITVFVNRVWWIWGITMSALERQTPTLWLMLWGWLELPHRITLQCCRSAWSELRPVQILFVRTRHLHTNHVKTLEFPFRSFHRAAENKGPALHSLRWSARYLQLWTSRWRCTECCHLSYNANVTNSRSLTFRDSTPGCCMLIFHKANIFSDWSDLWPVGCCRVVEIHITLKQDCCQSIRGLFANTHQSEGVGVKQ